MSENRLLFPAFFDRKTGQWRFVYDSGPNVKVNNITFVTFNIWFGDHYFYERIQALSKILKGANADIIALQEITNASLRLLLKEDWVKSNYFISDISGSTFYSYGDVLLSRIPIKSLNIYPLTSVMDRNLLIAEFEINEHKLLIGTTHLESLRRSSKVRSIQLKEIFTILDDSDNSVLMGDFNFCSSWEENLNIDTRYSDFWEILRPNEPGYTEDTDTNTMRRQLKREEKKVRFDRILFRSKSGCWKPIKINRLGMQPISTEYPDIFPSDHFGLIGKLGWCNK